IPVRGVSIFILHCELRLMRVFNDNAVYQGHGRARDYDSMETVLVPQLLLTIVPSLLPLPLLGIMPRKVVLRLYWYSMSVDVGTRLGSLEITALLGKGGMGEVYRARDTKLKRDVAIKILPEEFSRDADRVNRFQREAEVLASLNHPNIADI